MARIINSINGGFTGTVGTVTGYTRNGGSFMRSRHRRKDNIKTKKRLGQQEKSKCATNLQNHSQVRAFSIKASRPTAQPARAITGLPAPS